MTGKRHKEHCGYESHGCVQCAEIEASTSDNVGP